jgi:hypothetical protein
MMVALLVLRCGPHARRLHRLFPQCSCLQLVHNIIEQEQPRFITRMFALKNCCHPPSSAGASEVVLLDREPLALQCGLLSALATCGRQISVQGLNIQEGNTQQGSESASTQQDVSSSQHVICQQSEGNHPTNFGFHGPDLQQYLQGDSQSQSLNNHQHLAERQQPQNQLPRIRGQTFDWNAGPEPLLAEPGGRRFDVVLACDVLYESGAVEPIANLVPR